MSQWGKEESGRSKLAENNRHCVPVPVAVTAGSSRSGLLQTLLVVLLIDATLTAIRGVDFVRYVFTESRVALVGMMLWLGMSALSLLLFRRFRTLAAAGFAQYRPAVVTVVCAYLLSRCRLRPHSREPGKCHPGDRRGFRPQPQPLRSSSGRS